MSALGGFWWTSHKLARPLWRIREALGAASPLNVGRLAVPPEARQLREIDELVGAFDRLTERYLQTERELVEAEKAAVLGQLASGVAHETGTPLNVIKGNAQYLLRKLETDHPARRELQLIIKHSERIATMIQRLLEFSRPSEAHPVPLDLADLLAPCLEMAAPLGENVRVQLDLDPDTPAVLGDPGLLEHVLLNLLVNAYQAMPEGGRLGIVVGSTTAAAGMEAPDWVCCHMADQGVGIRAEHLGRIFQPFYSTKPPGKGTGLGLAIAQRIVVQHGGHIGVWSRPGVGTVFTLRLRTAELTGREPQHSGVES